MRPLRAAGRRSGGYCSDVEPIMEPAVEREGVRIAVRPTGVRVGTSGWMYRSWRGGLYPEGLPQRCWFDHYATQFDTVELNATFYRLPTLETAAGWAAAAPPGFEYAVKLGAFGSHRMKLNDPESWLPNHIARVRAMAPVAGVTVVQLPPRWRRSVARLDEFLSVACRLGPDVAWAVELREASWLHDDVLATLHDHAAALVIHDLLPSHPIELTAGWTYLRFHGPDAIERPYHGRYGPRRLRRWAARIDGWAGDGVGVRAYFNNDVEGAAVRDARWLRDAVVADG